MHGNILDASLLLQCCRQTTTLIKRAVISNFHPGKGGGGGFPLKKIMMAKANPYEIRSSYRYSALRRGSSRTPRCPIPCPCRTSPDTRPVPLVRPRQLAPPPSKTTSQKPSALSPGVSTTIFALNHDEAPAAPSRRPDADPRADQPLWGVALAVGPNLSTTEPSATPAEKGLRSPCEEAKELAANGGGRSRSDYMAAMSHASARYSKHDLHVQGQNYAKAMAILVAQATPDDSGGKAAPSTPTR